MDAQYPAIASAVSAIPAKQAYLDGELCGSRSDGTTSFSLIQSASDAGNADALVFFLFDLLYLGPAPLRDRKGRLQELLASVPAPLQYSDHQIGRGLDFYARACELGLEGIVSKRADAPYVPGNRGLWVKTKCLHREEFVIVGWTDPEGSRPWLGSLLLAYYDCDGRLVYAGRAGVGIDNAELERLWRRLQPLATDKMPLDVPPPRPIWLAAGAQPRPLGAPEVGRRGQISDLDRRKPSAPGCLRRAPRGQAGR